MSIRVTNKPEYSQQVKDKLDAVISACNGYISAGYSGLDKQMPEIHTPLLVAALEALIDTVEAEQPCGRILTTESCSDAELCENSWCPSCAARARLAAR